MQNIKLIGTVVLEKKSFELFLPYMGIYMQNIKLIGTVVLEKKSFEHFLPYMGMAAILNFER